jgi:3,4-dihydroxy 2-butanone 4-phosphate synthase/GTP cyclohydrolase II
MPSFEDWLAQADRRVQETGHPLVSLCYAQSLDGCLAAQRGQPLALSGSATRRLTHQLRARHDAILVGSGTVLADNPSLSVRLVEGPNPQPVILDSRLRTPLTANLVCRTERPVWIAATARSNPARRSALECAGARVLTLPEDSSGQVDLPALLSVLAGRGVRSLMVEGGAAVLSSFLAQDLADWVCVTVAPLYVGGLHVVEQALPALPRLQDVEYETRGADLVVWGRLHVF